MSIQGKSSLQNNSRSAMATSFDTTIVAVCGCASSDTAGALMETRRSSVAPSNLFGHAKRRLRIPDKDNRKKAIELALWTESKPAIDRLIAAAQPTPMADPGDDWDTDAWSLGAPNGVVA